MSFPAKYEKIFLYSKLIIVVEESLYICFCDKIYCEFGKILIAANVLVETYYELFSFSLSFEGHHGPF